MASKIRTFIVDDEDFAINLWRKYIEKRDDLEYVGHATDPLVALQVIPELNVQMVLVDMIMEGMSGIELIEALGPDYGYVCCTAHGSYGVDLSPLNIPAYLLKSNHKMFNQIVDICLLNMERKEVHDRAMEMEKLMEEGRLLIRVRAKNQSLYIPFVDIEVLFGKGDDTLIISKDRRYTAAGPLKYFEEQLPSLLFVRTNRGCIAAKRLIESLIGCNKLGLRPGSVLDTVPVSDRYKPDIIRELKIPTNRNDKANKPIS